MKNKSGVSLITLIITIIVVIILAVIVLRSGASDASDQAAFSKFTSQMGELQDAVKVAMLEAKADELLEGNSRSEAQLYNFIARGGYEGFEYERERAASPVAKTTPNDAKWLTMADAEKMKATLIYKNMAKESIGQDLPKLEVETASGVNKEVSYFVTPKGTVFCWPPYVYDGKSYVNANTTVKIDTDFDKNGELIIGVDEMGETEATDYNIKDGDRIIAFNKDEYIKVVNNVKARWDIDIDTIKESVLLDKGIVSLSKEPVDIFVYYTELLDGTPVKNEAHGVAEGNGLSYYDNR